jgi:hypothetical protein
MTIEQTPYVLGFLAALAEFKPPADSPELGDNPLFPLLGSPLQGISRSR